MATFRFLPSWYIEGAAIYNAHEALLEAGWTRSLEADPFIATGMMRVRDLLRDDRLPRL